jgi:hypothetical protein
MKKILFVAPCNPFINGGGSQATHAYLDATIEIFGRKNVTIMTFEEFEIPVNYKDLFFIKIAPPSNIKRLYQFIKGYSSRLTSNMIVFIKDHYKEYELCIINGGPIGGKAIKYLKQFDIKSVLIHHNYEVEYQKDVKARETLYGYYLGAIKNAEETSFKSSDLNLFLTNSDVQLFNKSYGRSKGKSYVIGTFDFKQREIEMISSFHKDYDIVISGSIDSYQTIVGIKDFVRKYLTISLNIIPSLKILFTGRNPSKEIFNICDSNPTLYSIVPNPVDILPVVQRGRIYLCPICIGGGLKLRAMDGLKCGLPVLVHEVSARGYDYFYEKPYFRIYNDEATFEAGLKNILSFLDSTTNSAEIINHDYYEYFGYQKGLERMRESFDSLRIKSTEDYIRM